MGGGSSNSGPSREELMNIGYEAGASGVSYNDVHHMTGGGGEDVLAAWKAGQQSSVQSEPHYPSFEYHQPSYHEPQSSAESDYPTYEEQMADQERLQQEAEERNRRIQGENDRDKLYSGYMDAASTATDYINSEIDREKSNAALLGIDYSITDEMKSQRISDYFATIWGEGEQGQLEALIGEWGNPAGFTGFTITRGDASTYASTAEEKQVGKSTTQKPKPTLATEEEDILGGATVLGA